MGEAKSLAQTDAQLGKFAQKQRLDLSPRFIRFWRDEVDGYTNKRAPGLPTYGGGAVKIKLVPPSMKLFQEAGVDLHELPHLVPLAKIPDEAELLAVDAVDPKAPVYMWDHETGRFTRVAPTLDAFLASLLGKGELSPAEKLEKAFEKAEKLYEKDRYAEGLALLEPIVRELSAPATEDQPFSGFDPSEVGLGDVANLLGIFYEETGRTDDAITTYEKALAAESAKAGLNLIRFYEKLGRVDDLFRVGEKIKEETPQYKEEAWIAVRSLLARGALRKGDVGRATEELKAILDEHVKQIELIDKIRGALAELAETVPTTATGVATILDWFKPKSYVLPAKENAANRAWWTALPEGVRAAILEEAKVDEDGIADDVALARALDIERLSLDKKTLIDEVSIFARLQSLRSLSFHGLPETLEPLRILPCLEDVNVNGNPIRDLRLPTRKNEPLFAAVAKGDRAGIAAALAAGADITAKNDRGHSVLMHLSHSEEVEVEKAARLPLMIHLVELGADPYADCGEFDDAKLDDDDFNRLVEVWRAQGRQPPDSPFRVLEASAWPPPFEDIEGVPRGFGHYWETDDPTPNAYVKRCEDVELVDYTKASRKPAIISDRLKTLIEKTDRLLAFPVAVRDHKGQRTDEKYWLIYPPAIECLDDERAEPSYGSFVTTVEKVKRMALIESSIPADVAIFRIERRPLDQILMRKSLAEACEKAGMTGIRFHLPMR